MSMGPTRRPWTPDSERREADRIVRAALPASRFVLRAFARWLEEERGLALGTITGRLGSARTFLDTLVGRGGTAVRALRGLTQDGLEEFFVSYGEDHGYASKRSMQAALRRLLQFGVTRGWTGPEAASGVPSLRVYRQSGLPRGANDKDLRRLVRAVTKTGTARDRALVLLFVTYGVRRGQVAALRLGDLDWAARKVHLPPQKGGKAVEHELTNAVAAALASYLRHERPQTATDQVFLRSRPPHLALSPAAITEVVRTALRRGGVSCVPYGPHALRHAFATRLLAAGQPTKTIADLLGHRSLGSTAIYAKVDRRRLLEVASEWPEVAS